MQSSQFCSWKEGLKGPVQWNNTMLSILHKAWGMGNNAVLSCTVTTPTNLVMEGIEPTTVGLQAQLSNWLPDSIFLTLFFARWFLQGSTVSYLCARWPNNMQWKDWTEYTLLHQVWHQQKCSNWSTMCNLHPYVGCQQHYKLSTIERSLIWQHITVWIICTSLLKLCTFKSNAWRLCKGQTLMARFIRCQVQWAKSRALYSVDL